MPGAIDRLLQSIPTKTSAIDRIQSSPSKTVKTSAIDALLANRAPSNTPTASSAGTPEKPKTHKMSEDLGGGEFNLPANGTLNTSERAYAGMPAQSGKERDHVIPVALGGTSNIDNLQYLNSPNGTKDKETRQEGKTKEELQIIDDYKKGKISLAEARGRILKVQRQIKGLEPKQGVSNYIIPSIKELPQTITTKAKDTVSGLLDSAKNAASGFKEFVDRPAKPMKDATGKVITENLRKEEDAIFQKGVDESADKTGEVAAAILQAPQRAITSVALQPVADIIGVRAEYTPSSAIDRLLLGKEPIIGAGQRAFDAANTVRPYAEKILGKDAGLGASFAIGPFAVAGSIGMDLTPFGGEEKAASKIALSKNADEIYGLIKPMFKNVAEDELRVMSKQLVDIARPNEVKDVILKKIAEKNPSSFVKAEDILKKRMISSDAAQLAEKSKEIPIAKSEMDTIDSGKDVVFPGSSKNEAKINSAAQEVDDLNKQSLAKFEEAFGKEAEQVPTPEASRIIGEDGKVKRSEVSAIVSEDGKLKWRPITIEDLRHANKEIDQEYRKMMLKMQLKKELNAAEAIADAKNVAESAVKVTEPPTNSFLKMWNRTFQPLKNQDADVQRAFRVWTRKKIVGREIANSDLLKVSVPNEEGLKTILAFEKGVETPYNHELKQIFNDFYDEAFRRGVNLPYRENYLPQVYKESPDQVQKAMARYMQDQGVGEESIKAYLSGVAELPEEVVRRLKINPSFIKSRAFPNYETAMAYGLTPRYTNPAQLVAFYRNELEQAVANKEFIDRLVEKGKIFPAEIAPSNFVELGGPFSPKKYYADPELAKMINGIFVDENHMKLDEWLINRTVWLSKGMQDIALSAGIPKTQINFFSMGQSIKEITAGDFKAAQAFFRGHSDTATLKFFEENRTYLKEMAEQGIDVGSRIGNYETVYKNLAEKMSIGEKVSRGWGKLFNEKPFNSFLPQLYTQTFKDAKQIMLKKGYADTEARSIAADVVRNFYGVFEDVGRGKQTDDAISSVFFAPRFRQGVIGSLFNTGKAGVDFMVKLGGLRGKLDPALYKNRRLLAGMIISYAGYNAVNKKLTGHYMWDNPPGKEFALMIPLKNDDVAYFEFMPSYLAFARNMASGVIAFGKGDWDTAKQKFGSLASMPIKILSEVWANKDYFGRAIYKEYDSGKTKAAKSAKHIIFGSIHPYIKEIYNQITTDKPLYQSVSEAIELPFKFSSLSKIDQQEFYTALEKQKNERSRMRENEIRPIYEQIKQLDLDGKTDKAEKLFREKITNAEQFSIYKSLKTSDKSRKTRDLQVEMYSLIKRLKELDAVGNKEEADRIFNEAIKTKEQYKAYQFAKKKLGM